MTAPRPHTTDTAQRTVTPEQVEAAIAEAFRAVFARMYRGQA